jgi:hypothetical protein
MMQENFLTYNNNTLTLNLANLELGEAFRDFPFILFIYLFIFDFMTCNDGKQKHAMENE